MTPAAAARRRRLAEAIREAGLDLLLVFGNAWQNDYLRYAADFGLLEGEGLAVVTRDGDLSLFLDHLLEADRAAVECPDLTVSAHGDLLAAVAGALDGTMPDRLGVAPRALMPFGLRKTLHGATDATDLVDRLLMVKEKEELDAIRSAAHLADRGYEVFRRAARAGRADYELVAETEAFFRAAGVDDNFMLIGSGGVEMRGMTPPVGRRLQPGDQVITELTPCVDGYYVQICRSLVIGEPNAAQRRAFDIWHRAMVAGIDAVRPGVRAAEVARAENDVFRAEGLGDYVTSQYTRVRGHGLGLFPDTKPHILETVETPVEAGMVLIVHPNTYHPEVGYLVFGDSLIVTPEGAEVLTATPRELFSVPEGGSTE